MYAENEPVMKRNETVPIELPGERYTIEANDKIPVGINTLYPLYIIH